MRMALHSTLAMIRVNVQRDDRRNEKSRATATAFMFVGLPFRSSILTECRYAGVRVERNPC